MFWHSAANSNAIDSLLEQSVCQLICIIIINYCDKLGSEMKQNLTKTCVFFLYKDVQLTTILDQDEVLMEIRAMNKRLLEL